ncbi:hypothetical protein [Haladaptatus sp. GCM10025893]|uniref:hypothetical protein n=1 Tax=Haladaptatus sp. GCM10025893 TaxID=3252659 RepID=UPI00361A57DE
MTNEPNRYQTLAHDPTGDGIGRSIETPVADDHDRRPPNRYKLLARGFNKRVFSLLNPDGYYRHGIDLFAEDWDNCIILDACRYDMLAAATHSLGPVDSRRSRGSGTKQFLRANLHGKQLLDTVYVTANPQLCKHREEISVAFYAEDDVWRDGWDTSHKTVTPEILTERALAAADRYPEKRLLVHYMQPHYPFIGSPHDFDKQGHIFESKYSFWRSSSSACVPSRPTSSGNTTPRTSTSCCRPSSNWSLHSRGRPS